MSALLYNLDNENPLRVARNQWDLGAEKERVLHGCMKVILIEGQK